MIYDGTGADSMTHLARSLALRAPYPSRRGSHDTAPDRKSDISYASSRVQKDDSKIRIPDKAR